MGAADRTSLAVCVDLLGPLALRVDGRVVAVPGGRRRALLAVLALEAGRVVGTDRLVDVLWPDDPPESAAQALYNHVSRLRAHLRPHADRLERYAGGYRLHLEPGELDVDAARTLAEDDRPREALALWRAPALEEFQALPALEAEAVGLRELRLRLTDDVLEARLRHGDRGVAADAAGVVVASPLRERTTLLLVQALAAEGRTAEAMAAARGFRRRLVEETGLDPGPALADLEQQVAGGLTSPVPRRAVSRPDGPLVGRQQDREEVLRLLGAHAVVTVAGPGGVGKTRLVLDVASDPMAGQGADVVLVDLASVDRPDQVCQAVATTLGLRTTGAVRPVDVAAGLAGRDVLLVLDNCEHLSAACRDLLVTLRRDARGVRVLATSRVTLHVPGEYVVRLQPLPVPRGVTDLDALRRQAGVRAFVEHARRRRPEYDVTAAEAADLVEVLRRLDGLPLGIELAARQVAVMPVRAVRDRLDRALDLATGAPGDGDHRQRTLRATIDSSYRLLGAYEQRLLRALAPFPGGCDLATVENLAAEVDPRRDPLDLLHRLVDASLVVADTATGRYRLLFTVRAFLLDVLRVTGGLEAAEEVFLERCVAVAAEVGTQVFGADEPEADRRLRAELDNLRAARDVARAHGRDEVRVSITTSLDEASTWRDLRELWTWALELAADPQLSDHPQRARLLGAAAEAARLVGDLDGAERLADQLLALLEEEPDPLAAERAWSALGSVAHFRGDFEAATRAWLRSSEVGTPAAGSFISSAALAASYGGDPAYARELLDRAQAVIDRAPSGSHVAFAAYVEGELVATDRPDEAMPHYVTAIDEARRCGATFVEGVASVALASARTRTGDLAGAADGFAYLLDLWRRTGQQTQLWTTARNAAGLLAATGSPRTAALLLICADAQPGAAAVGPVIARHSGRSFVEVDTLVAPALLPELTAEAARLTPGGVLDRAREELGALSRPAR
jgi:predicted ATPase/DNA-binding SARP family transcriptional activator